MIFSCQNILKREKRHSSSSVRRSIGLSLNFIHHFCLSKYSPKVPTFIPKTFRISLSLLFSFFLPLSFSFFTILSLPLSSSSSSFFTSLPQSLFITLSLFPLLYISLFLFIYPTLFLSLSHTHTHAHTNLESEKLSNIILGHLRYFEQEERTCCCCCCCRFAFHDIFNFIC